MSKRYGFHRRVRIAGAALAAALVLTCVAACNTDKASADTGTGAGAGTSTGAPITDDAPGPPASVPSTAVQGPGTAAPTKSPKPSASASPSSSGQCVKPKHGTYTVATGGSAIVGRAGRLYHYEVQVQNGIGVTPAEFATAVEGTLGDPLGWTDSGTRRFQRVSGGTCDFVVELATASTSEQECTVYGLHTGGHVSCRGGKEVIINLDRWNTGDPAPEWDGHLDVYRDLVVDHEVGHFLGYHHMACGTPGGPLPVMATPYNTGLQGCVINGLPFDSNNQFISGPPET
jgi:hypothetical protein